MKLLTSLLFTAVCIISAVNAAEPVAPASTAHTAAHISGSVEKNHNDISQAEADATQMSDLRELKRHLKLYAAVWGSQLVKSYSEGGQNEFLNQGEGYIAEFLKFGAGYIAELLKYGSGYIAMQTFESALKYYKLNWLTPELTISSVKPYVVLFVVTALSIVVNEYNLQCVMIPLVSTTVGLWISLYDDYQNQRDKRSLNNAQRLLQPA